MRWWLRPGEIAAYVTVPGRSTMPLIFKNDDSKWWEFELDGRKPCYDHRNGHYTIGLDRNDPADGSLITAVADIGAKLMGGRARWDVRGEEQIILNLLATELPKGQAVTGRRVRAHVRKELGIRDPDEAEERTNQLIGQLIPRYLFMIAAGDNSDMYQLTLAGLLQSNRGNLAAEIIKATLTVFRVKYHGDDGPVPLEGNPDFDLFSLDELLRCGTISEEDRLFAARAVPILGLASNEGTRQDAPPVVGWTWYRPDDIERLADCRDLADYWKATRKGLVPRRPWPTAPLLLKETVAETERRKRLAANVELADYVAQEESELGASLDQVRRSAVVIADSPSRPPAATAVSAPLGRDGPPHFAAQQIEKLQAPSGSELPSAPAGMPSISDAAPLVDFIVLTAIEVERRAVCKAFAMTDLDRVKVEGRVYWRRHVELRSGEFYCVVIAQSADMANVDMALLASDALHHWKPGGALLVGIAASADESARLGDIVVGSDVYYYERGKVAAAGTKPEPKIISPDATLWNNITALPDWAGVVAAERPDGTAEVPGVHRGVIASGEKVIADEAERDRIASAHRKILAIEMEGYGFSRAVWQSFQRVRHIVIRSVCDDGSEAKNDAWHGYAAAAAAAYARHFLDDIPLTPRNTPEGAKVVATHPQDVGKRTGGGAGDATYDGPAMSASARKLLTHLVPQYVKAGFPNHRVWSFTLPNRDPHAEELRALGLISMSGTRRPTGTKWLLTDRGQRWVMAHRDADS